MLTVWSSYPSLNACACQELKLIWSSYCLHCWLLIACAVQIKSNPDRSVCVCVSDPIMGSSIMHERCLIIVITSRLIKLLNKLLYEVLLVKLDRLWEHGQEKSRSRTGFNHRRRAARAYITNVALHLHCNCLPLRRAAKLVAPTLHCTALGFTTQRTLLFFVVKTFVCKTITPSVQ